MRAAHYCDDLEALVDVARSFNEDAFFSPLPDAEVVRAARSAWQYTEKGTNRFGKGGGASITREEMNIFLAEPDALHLLTFLRIENGPNAKFWVANGLADSFNWSRKRMAAAQRKLIKLGYIKQVRGAGRSVGPALYEWSKKGGPN